MQDNYQASNYHAMQPEQSGIMGTLRNHALSGLAAIALGATVVMGVKDASAQEQVASLDIQGTNLASYGVPDLGGLTPFRTRTLNKTDAIPGEETTLEFYNTGGSVVAVYTARGRPYAVAMDSDNQRPLDLMLIDFVGSGMYTPIPSDQDFSAPDWVVRN